MLRSRISLASIPFTHCPVIPIIYLYHPLIILQELIKYHSELKKQVDALRPIPEPEVQAIAEAKDEDEEKAEDEGESSAGVDEKLGGLKIGEAEQGEKDGKRGKAEKGSESASEGE